MPIHADVINCKNTLRAQGHQVWTTEGATAPYIPYGGGYYTSLFYNVGGYAAMTGRMYVNCSISQQHQGTYDFTLSRYGGGVSNRSSGGMNSYISWDTPLIGTNEYMRWTKTNGSSWGNGTLDITCIIWGAGADRFVSGYPGMDDNFSSSQTGNFFVRAA